jgi:hypothetical protein
MTSMTKRRRLWVVVFSGLAIVAIVLLAAGLADLEFLPGRPLARRAQAEDTLGAFFGKLPGTEICGFLFMAVYFIAILLLPIAIVYVIISPDARRRVLRSLGLLLWLLALYVVMRGRPDLLEEFQLQPSGFSSPDGLKLRTVDFAASFPQWAVLLTTIGLAVFTAAALVGAAWFLWRRSRPPASPLEELAREAQEALDALEDGAEVKDTVMRCYFEMSRVLSEQRGLRRAKAMTPREFERQLKETGLPDRHVEQLTRLFERVRYGARVPEEEEEHQAIACLTAIVQACKGSP